MDGNASGRLEQEAKDRIADIEVDLPPLTKLPIPECSCMSEHPLIESDWT